MVETRNFPELNSHTENAAAFLLALAHEKRMLILNTILHREMSVGELAAYTNLGLSSLSQHLSKLREQNLVTARRVSQTVYYKVTSPKVEPMLNTLSAMYLPPAAVAS
jgi:DNA-binding transcriptional ArsR family regulator